MKIIVDDKIPYIKGQVEQLGDEVLYLSGSQISADDVRDADVLMIRTRTHCNRELLEGSKVKFVVTATIGFDHIDTGYMEEAGIEWSNCPGCNAASVGQYVRNSLFLLAKNRGLNLAETTLGIVGVGHVGTAVLEACKPWVKEVLLNDPPRQSAGFCGEHVVDLQTIAERCDVITFHTPLVRDGEWPSYHLADEAFLKGLARRPVIINAARGEVVDNFALEKALNEGWISDAVVDTWENEPHVARTLLNKVYIGTPHVAGYSADGKANATRMSLQAVARWMGKDVRFQVNPPSVPDTCMPVGNPVEDALLLYDPRQDSERLKADPDGFEYQRGNYPLRRETFA